ncbi:hypothetical protein ED28_07245 [[Pantoea] beijingensis]|uniref:Uncharacterized protein n=1 Tax=[Pantoea] beijingensis TaxID=1324864 RepID=A0A443IEU8_9GAMM|nr:hypothetical protein ED28_07245 [[Pantoea] beijingensis]
MTVITKPVSFLFLPLLCRMRTRMHRLQSPDVHLRVDLGGFNAPVPRHRLYPSEVCPVLLHLRCHRASKPVFAGGLYAGHTDKNQSDPRLYRHYHQEQPRAVGLHQGVKLHPLQQEEDEPVDQGISGGAERYR